MCRGGYIHEYQPEDADPCTDNTPGFFGFFVLANGSLSSITLIKVGSMSSGNESSGSQAPRKAAPDDNRPRFAFVTETSQSNARSHAMREHWRQRHSRNNSTKTRRFQPKLLPNISSAADRGPKLHEVSTHPRSSRSRGSPSSGQQCSETSSNETDQEHDDRIERIGVPSQLLSGVGRALSSSRLDPFQTFPVQLTSQHHKLLHHCMYLAKFKRLGLICNCLHEYRDRHSCNYDVRRSRYPKLQSNEGCMVSTGPLQCILIQRNHGTCRRPSIPSLRRD